MRYSKKAGLTALAVALTLAAAACGDDDGGGGGGGSGDGDLAGTSVTVGSKEFTEQLLLGQITILALQDAGADVTDETGLTGTTNVRQALESDEIDMYWEYTGTGWSELLGNDAADAADDGQALFDEVAQQDAEENGIAWLALSEANNTYAFATSQEASDEYGVTTLSEYAELASSDPESASMCAAAEFLDRADGWPGLEEAYGFELPDEHITEVELTIIYETVPERDPCEFGEVFETAGQIPANDLVVLEDDQAYFVAYNLAMTMKETTLEETPALEDVLTPIADALTTEVLQELNAQVDVEGLPAEQVAEAWLEDNELIG